MHGPINVKSPNNTSKWQMGFNSAFKGLMQLPSYQLLAASPVKPRNSQLQLNGGWRYL
jgi:hypothetical protein